MKEFNILSQDEKFCNIELEKPIGKLTRKYSVDVHAQFKNQKSNLYSFSGIIDDQFLNPCSFSSFQELPHSYPEQFSHGGLQSPTCYSPSTPSSFGFRGSQFRIATVQIAHLDQCMIFSKVRLFLVSDMQDMNKAGLLFKNQDKQIDLKIQKNQGKLLEKVGKLEAIQCHLWVDEFSHWVQVTADIKLED